ncbi:MAG: hypothetical protein HXS44_17320 [Theionarchaea archaeon]|nr:hypothetical protein [Theionarchaea archaeon]
MKIVGSTKVRRRGGSLFEDPIGWTQETVGSTIRFWIMVCLHILVGGALIVFFGSEMIIFLLFITFFPILYLYAMKKLLEEIE